MAVSNSNDTRHLQSRSRLIGLTVLVLIYASLGLSGFKPLLLNACWTTFTIVGNVWTFFYVDRYGRRTFLLIGACGCTTALIFLCALTASFLGTTNQAGLNVSTCRACQTTRLVLTKSGGRILHLVLHVRKPKTIHNAGAADSY